MSAVDAAIPTCFDQLGGFEVDRVEHGVAELGVEAGVDDVHAVAVDVLAQPCVAALTTVAFEALVAFDRAEQVAAVLGELFGGAAGRIIGQQLVMPEERRLRRVVQAGGDVGRRVGVSGGDVAGFQSLGE